MLYWLHEQTGEWLMDLGLYRFGPSLLESTANRALGAVGIAFMIVLGLGPRTIATLTRLKIGDSGLTDAEALRKHSAGKANTPTMGGVLIAGAILASVGLLADLGNYYIALGMIVLVWLAALGGFDDWLKLTAASRGAGSRQGLLAWEKLVFQLGLGLLVGIFAYSHGATLDHDQSLAHALNLPFQKTYQTPGYAPAPGLVFLPQWAFITLSVLMIAGMSNAVNITDGMDGLATGVTGIATLGLMPLAYVAGTQAQAQYLLVPFIDGAAELTVLAGAMLGACLGFLWWNSSPAQVFMGDTGSLCLGGLIGYIAIVTRQEAVVLLMSGVFLVEIGSVAMQVGYYKATRGKRIFRCAPYHHHLHMGGWTEQKVVARFWIISVLLVVAALASLKLR